MVHSFFTQQQNTEKPKVTPEDRERATQLTKRQYVCILYT